MKPLTLNLSKMKKIGGDKHHTIFQHEMGHQIKIAHAGISPIQRKQIEKLQSSDIGEKPVSEIEKFSSGGPVIRTEQMEGKNGENGQKGLEAIKDSGNFPEKDYAEAMSVRNHYSPYSANTINKANHEFGTGNEYFKMMNEYADGGEVNRSPAQYSEGNRTIATDEDADKIKAFADKSSEASPEEDVVPLDSGKPRTPEQIAKIRQEIDSFKATPTPGPTPMAGDAFQDQSSGSGKDWEGSYGVEPPFAPDQSQEQKIVQSSAEQSQPSDLEGQLKGNQQTIDNIYKEKSAMTGQFKKLMENGQIKPERYFHDASVGKKISSAIAMILGGASAGLSGGRNPAVEYFNKAIDNDIEAQKNDQSNKMNLFKLHREALGDDMAAALQTRNNYLQMADVKLKQEIGALPGPMAEQRAALMKSQIDQEINMNNYRLSAMRSAQVGGDDPAKLVQFLVPKEHQAKAFGEIEAAENTRNMSKSILDSFEQAAKENTVMRTGAGLLRTPGSVYALHQAMQPTFKDLEGTVRQAAMDNTFKNITPMPGDADHKIQEKREALQNYLKSKLSAPTARGYGIDLSKFNSTAPMEGAQQVAMMNGVQYIKVPGGWKRMQ